MSTIATPNQKLLQGVPQNSPERVLVNHPAQSATAIDRWKSVLFGLPFFAVGVFVEFAAFHRSETRKDAPIWLICVIGSFFLLAGAFLIVHGIRGILRKSAYDKAAAQAPHQPWLYDHHWHREGFTFSAFNSMLQRLLFALCWNAFLIPFFWIGTQRGAWLFAVGAGFFALMGLFLWYRFARMLGEFLRYGDSFLAYNNFPYFLGSTLSARLRAPNHLPDFDELKLTLRCVQERYITSNSGGERTTSVVCFELWSNSQTLSSSQLAAYANGEIPIEFALPEAQPSTALAATPPTYWEIEANGKSSRAAYEAFFLVPVYKPN